MKLRIQQRNHTVPSSQVSHRQRKLSQQCVAQHGVAVGLKINHCLVCISQLNLALVVEHWVIPIVVYRFSPPLLSSLFVLLIPRYSHLYVRVHHLLLLTLIFFPNQIARANYFYRQPQRIRCSLLQHVGAIQKPSLVDQHPQISSLRVQRHHLSSGAPGWHRIIVTRIETQAQRVHTQKVFFDELKNLGALLFHNLLDLPLLNRRNRPNRSTGGV